MVTVISVITRLCWGNIESLELSQLSSQQWTLDSHKLVYHVQLSLSQNIVQGRLWLLYLVRLKRDSFPQHLLSLQDVLQRPRAMRWYHAFQTSCVQIPAFFKLLVFKPQVVTLHLRIALPARQCTLLAPRYIFDHS